MLVEHLPAAAVDVAHRRADLRVGVAVDVLLQEVEEPPLALQEREQLHRRAVAVGGARLEHGGAVIGCVESSSGTPSTLGGDGVDELRLLRRQRAPLERLGRAGAAPRSAGRRRVNRTRKKHLMASQRRIVSMA